MTNTIEAGAGISLTGDTISFIFSASDEGKTFSSAAFNGDVITDDNPNSPAITGVTISSTNISGLTAADISFGMHNINVNQSGLTLPTGVQGSIVLGVQFANETSSVASLIAHPST